MMPARTAGGSVAHATATRSSASSFWFLDLLRSLLRGLDVTPSLLLILNDLGSRLSASGAEDAQVRTRLVIERNELLARQWLSDVMDDIEAEISRKQTIAKIEEAKRSTLTHSITRLSTDLTGEYSLFKDWLRVYDE